VKGLLFDLKPKTILFIFAGLNSSPKTHIKCFGTFSHYATSYMFGIVALTAMILIFLLRLIILLTIASRVAPLS
jgi:hypothetical protein